MKRAAWLTLCLVLAYVGLRSDARRDPPRLMVVLVVDQMRADYLEHYSGLFSGGFARLLTDGARFTEAHQDHAATVTAVGHATIATGAVPARSGIVGNDFFDRSLGETVYSAFDPDASILGPADGPGRSPRRLRRSGLADWLKDASPKSRVFSMALKDRSAIMMGGHAADGAYWYHGPAEGIVTSTYYASEYPDWVTDFRSEAQIASFYRDSFTHTPYADEVILQLARTAVESEGLGDDDAPDLLFLSMSAADHIGHRFGPYSPEVQEYYTQLDRYLGALFEYLDDEIGADRWGLVLSGDHGATVAPEELSRRGLDAGRISDREFAASFRSALNEAARETRIEPVPTLHWLNGPHLISDTATPQQMRRLRRAIAERLEEVDFVEVAFTSDEVSEADPAGQEIINRFRRSYDPERSPDVMYLLKPNHLVGSTTAGHGSAYRYDMHVPLVFMGPGIASGSHEIRVQTVDIAPTVARLLGIPTPDDLDGRALREITR